jgi:hypothetical protein
MTIIKSKRKTLKRKSLHKNRRKITQMSGGFGWIPKIGPWGKKSNQKEEQQKKWTKARSDSTKRKANIVSANIKHNQFVRDIYPYLSESEKKNYNTNRFHENIRTKYNTNIAYSKEFHPSNEVFSLGAYTVQHVLGNYNLPPSERKGEFFSTAEIMKAQNHVNATKMDVSQYSHQELYNILKSIAKSKNE